jgi:hypothetical protein
MATETTVGGPTTVYWGTDYAGQTIGSTDCNAKQSGDQGPLQPGGQLNINSSNDLSKIIVADSGGCVHTIQYAQTAGVRQFEIRVYGQGPAGESSGSLDLYFLDTNGYVHTLSVTKACRHLGDSGARQMSIHRGSACWELTDAPLCPT